MTKPNLLPHAAVENVDVIRNLSLRLLSNSEAAVINLYSFQRTPATVLQRIDLAPI